MKMSLAQSEMYTHYMYTLTSKCTCSKFGAERGTAERRTQHHGVHIVGVHVVGVHVVGVHVVSVRTVTDGHSTTVRPAGGVEATTDRAAHFYTTLLAWSTSLTSYIG